MAGLPEPDYELRPPSYSQVIAPHNLQRVLSSVKETDSESLSGYARGSFSDSTDSRHSSEKRPPSVPSKRNHLYPNDHVNSISTPNSRRSSRVPSRGPSPTPSHTESMRHETTSARTATDTRYSSEKRPSSVPSKRNILYPNGHVNSFSTPNSGGSSRVPSRGSSPTPSHTESTRMSSDELPPPQDCTPTADNSDSSPYWDMFKTTPLQKVTCNTEACFTKLLQSAKLLAYIFIFTGTLFTAIVSKGSLLVLTGHLGSMSKVQLSEQDGLVYLLLFVLCIPHAFSFLISCASGWFKNDLWPSKQTLALVAGLETFHSAGQTFFVMYVMPRLQPMKILTLLMATGLVPALTKIVCFQQNAPKWKRILDILAFVFQLSAIVSILVEEVLDLEIQRDIENQTQTSVAISNSGINSEWTVKILTVLSLVALTIRWWESYACTDISFRSYKIPLKQFAIRLHKSRAKTHIFISVWKLFITVLVTYLIFGHLADLGNVFHEWFSNIQLQVVVSPNLGEAFAISDDAVSAHILNSSNVSVPVKNNSVTDVFSPNLHLDLTDWILVGAFLLQLLFSWGLYHLATVSCKLHMQRSCFAIPLTMASPLLLGGMAMICVQFAEIESLYSRYLPRLCQGQDEESVWKCLGMGLAWWLSSIWITVHIWTPDNERLAFVDRLFVIPLFDPVLLGQSFLYARRIDDHFDRKEVIKGDNVSNDSAFVDSPRSSDSDPTTIIYICATMWHENVNEMVQMLKSVFRLDRDQSKRRNFRDLVSDFKDTDYYEFEAHIFFDDSMDMTEEGVSEPNGFVQQLVTTIEQAASEIHQVIVTLPAPTKMVTPYGGRLEWKFPGGNRLVAHLKDKNKIRHRKRWSQVMYMYYLLGYRMFLDTDETINIPRDSYESVINQLPPKIRLKAENTYVLALDGDVDFKPEAVLLLVDMMKKNKHVGAACGRIKPIGSGPVMWYQKFEYAIGHWLQKAAEHMYGCVLCSPGCFSLFRGLALMDNNVMRTYATKPTEARHFLQYDQGEDRWLCTLLLQKGYKIEYCAAADALTYVPETFKEFFNQRRRWGPSTTANIMDLLGSFRETVKVNPNISYLYMLYQFVLLASSLLGPATVLLMVETSLQSVFHDLPGWATYTMTFGPTVIFVIMCFKCKPDTQLVVAAIFSSFYGLVMMAVIAGTIVNIIQDGWYTPNAIFLYIVIGVFVIAAGLHPQEMFDLPWGFLYFLCVPSTFIYLMIYSMCNLNIVSWGTREVKKPVVIEEKKTAGRGGASDTEDPVTSAMEEIRNNQQNQPSGLLRYLNIFSRDSRVNNMALLAVLQVLRDMRSSTQQPNHGTLRPRRRQRLTSVSSADERSHPVPGTDEDTGIELDETEEESTSPDEWTTDPKFGNGKLEQMDEKEKQFFEGLIQKYLHPLAENKEEKDKISADLIELRNNVSFAFFMLNGLWLVIMIALQEVKSFVNITIMIDGTPLRMEPLGLLFLVIFAIILVLQFAAMIMHRYDTFTHILSITNICQCYGQQSKQEMSLIAMEKIDALQSFSAVRVDDETPELSPDYPEEDTDVRHFRRQSSLEPDYGADIENGNDFYGRNRGHMGTLRHNFSRNIQRQRVTSQFGTQKMTLENLYRHLEQYPMDDHAQHAHMRMSRYPY